MTEEEAKTKWCPHVRSVCGRRNQDNSLGVLSGSVFNSVWVEDEKDQPIRECYCIGSACAMWRWDEGQPAPIPGCSDKLQRERPGNGYCGLAGKP